MIRDILLAPDTVADACFGTEDVQRGVRNVVAAAVSNNYRLWQYTGSLHQVVTAGHEALRAAGHTDDAARGKLVRDRLSEFNSPFQWLAALSEDGDVLGADDPVAEQLLRAHRRLNGAHLVTGAPRLLEGSDEALTSRQMLEAISDEQPIDFIDLKEQQDRIRPELERGVFGVLRHGRYVLGPEVAELETRLAEFVGVKHCVTVASGTDALLIPLMALQVGAGDEVITVPYTWISSAEVIAVLGARTVFVDVRPDTFNIDPERLEEAISPQTKAIMPVAIYGQCADMDAINEIAGRHGIPVIEDAAQSFGATYHGRRSAGLSRIGSTSFFPSKPLGCYGDGGGIFTDDDRLADLFRQIRVHGQKKKHHHEVIGLNGRFDTVQAAVLLAKLDQFEDECKIRSERGEYYTSMILDGRASLQSGDDSCIEPPTIADGNTSVFAQYTVTSEYNQEIHQFLQEHQVPSVQYYAVPLHLQPAFSNLGYAPGDFPVSESIARRGLSLPMSAGLKPAQQERIVDLVFQAISQRLAIA